MLAEPVDRETLLSLAENPDWVFAQKLDGKRKLVELEDGNVTTWSRNGVATDLPWHIAEVFKDMKGHFLFDGELLRLDQQNQRLFIFDMPKAGHIITKDSPFKDRLLALQNVAQLCNWPDLRVLSVLTYATGTSEKLHLVEHLMENRCEGVMARSLLAPYQPGRRSRQLLKHKYIKTVDCVITEKGRDGKDNLVLSLYKDGVLTEIGKCTALAGEGLYCQVGRVIEVTYLYMSDDERLVQPTLPKLRLDKNPEECLFDQLILTNKKVM